MNKLINFLKRYYKCIYDFILFKEYLKEPLVKALVFLLPLFLVFTFQTYLGSLEVPNKVVESMDYYYDFISTMTYDDVIDFEIGPDPEDETITWEIQPDDRINFRFVDSKVELDQNKVFDEKFEDNGRTYRLILDTKHTLDVTGNLKGTYSDEEKELMGYDTAYFVAYVADDFITMNIDDMIYTRDLSSLKGSQGNTLDIYQFSKENYVQGLSFFIFSLLVTLFLYLMYYVVVYIISKSTTKRQGYKLTKGRLVRICLYAMQPGMYAYFILTFIMKKSQVGLSFLVPLISMIVMSYVASKSLEHVKDYVKREARKIRKDAKKAELQDV